MTKVKVYNRFAFLQKLPAAPEFLDVVYKSGDSVQAVSTETGELFTFQAGAPVPADGAGLVDRFTLQGVARHALKKYRVARCLRSPISKNHHISVYKNAAHNSVFFGGLQACGSIWHCPVCAAKISERRSEEVKQAFDYCLNLGGCVSFITRTIPHKFSDNLKDILYQFRDAETKLKQQRHYKATLKRFGVFGSIKVFEITVGKNGWHLHVHEVMFHQPINIKNLYQCLEANFYSLWADAAVKAGFDCPSREHGLQVQNGDYAAAYFAKWGKEMKSSWRVNQELTKQHIKKSKGGFSPFDLFRAFRDFPSLEVLELIQEYGDAMHGARQLIWSRGLKKLVDVVEFTDEEIAAQIEEEAQLMGLISLEQWRFIVKKDLRVDVLLICKYHDFNALVVFLRSIGAPDFVNS